MEVFKRNAFAKMSLCVVLLVSGCSMGALKRDKKPNNITYSENLQEKFEEIDLNNDGVIDKAEARKHEENKPAKTDFKTPTSSFLLIMGFMAVACMLPITFTYVAGKIRDFREKKRV